MTSFELGALAIAAVAALYDLRTGHIPNWLTLGSLCVGSVAHAAVGALSGGAAGLAYGLADAVLGAVVCGAVPLLVFLRGGIGGGDVKLFAALGAVCLARDGLLAELSSFVIALLLAPACLAYEGKLLRTIGNALTLVANPFRRPEARRTPPPELMAWFRLAPAIFLGTASMLVLQG